MEPWVLNAMRRWPNVPYLFGWLRLDRRGRWLIRNEYITRPQIIDTINANYAADELGRWYFQNGPQRGYVQLDYAPLVAARQAENLLTHSGQRIERLQAIHLDEEGSLLLVTEHGPALLGDSDLDWALSRISSNGQPVTEEQLLQVLEMPSDTVTLLRLHWRNQWLPITRTDSAKLPGLLGFVRHPLPQRDEKVSATPQD